MFYNKYKFIFLFVPFRFVFFFPSSAHGFDLCALKLFVISMCWGRRWLGTVQFLARLSSSSSSPINICWPRIWNYFQWRYFVCLWQFKLKGVIFGNFFPQNDVLFYYFRLIVSKMCLSLARLKDLIGTEITRSMCGRFIRSALDWN